MAQWIPVGDFENVQAIIALPQKDVRADHIKFPAATPLSSHATHVAGCMQSHACSYEPLQMLLPYAREIETSATMEMETSTV